MNTPGMQESPHVIRAENRMVARSLKFRSLLVLTASIGVVVIVVQTFYPKSWLETGVLALASVAAIAGWLSSLRRD